MKTGLRDKKTIAFVGNELYSAMIIGDGLDRNHYEFRAFPFSGDSAALEVELRKFSPDVTFFFCEPNETKLLLSSVPGLKVLWTDIHLPHFYQGKVQFSKKTVENLAILQNQMEAGFDFIFHVDPSKRTFLESNGVFLSGYQWIPVNTDTFFPKVDLEKKWDVCFFGEDSVNRLKYFGHVKHVYNFFHAASGIEGREYLTCLQNTKVATHISEEPLQQWSPIFPISLACGIPIVTEDRPLDEFFIAGVHYLSAPDPWGYFQAVERVIQYDEKINKMQNSGVLLAKIHFSVQAVLPRLLDDIFSGVTDTPYFNKHDFLGAQKKFNICLEYDGFEHLLVGDHFYA